MRYGHYCQIQPTTIHTVIMITETLLLCSALLIGQAMCFITSTFNASDYLKVELYNDTIKFVRRMGGSDMVMGTASVNPNTWIGTRESISGPSHISPTPTTANGFTTITFADVGDAVHLVWTTTRGWTAIGGGSGSAGDVGDLLA